jgi:predicted alpha/beta hydrolase family esterase
VVAWLQRLIIAGILISAGLWFFYFNDHSPTLAVAGSLVIVLGYTALLALEFVFLNVVNRSDSAPQASVSELVRAWVGESLVAPQVFGWRQPFFANAIADNLTLPGAVHGKRGIVFIHGFFCNRGLWTPWLKQLHGTGHACVALSMEPVFGSIDQYTPQIEAAVRQVTLASGLAPVLVCHSMGGLAARAWLQAMKAEARVHHVVTIGTPHGGTWLARFSRSKNTREMRLASVWQTRLNEGMPANRNSLFTCWYSNSDNIVFPTSTATLPHADNRMLRGVAHVQMAFEPRVMKQTLGLLAN